MKTPAVRPEDAARAWLASCLRYQRRRKALERRVADLQRRLSQSPPAKDTCS